MSLTLQQLAQMLGLEFRGDPALAITAVASLTSAKAGSLCFVQSAKYFSEIIDSQCSAVIVPVGSEVDAQDKALLWSTHPQYHFARAIPLLTAIEVTQATPSIHPSAQISESASIATGVEIAALVVIEEGVTVGAGSTIGPGSVIGSNSNIGKNCKIHSNVSIGRGIKIGDRCELHSGVVIGSDGFGLVMHEQQWEKIPHLGTVLIENDVEIGANTTIDRGALDDTVIETGCKLDNQIQVGHNVHIGAHTAIAACVGIAGSAIIGRYCKISGAAVVLGHLSVVDNVTITAMSLVTKDIKTAGVYSSGTPLLENSIWHKNNVRYKSLDKLARTVARLEKESH